MVLSREQEAVVLRLVEHFVRRQRLVLELIRDVRPHLLSAAPVRPPKEVMAATSKGTWGSEGEWRFHMHGLGCKMVHILTGEPLDWQPPDLKRFDVYCFQAWLGWYWDQLDVEPDVKGLRQRLESKGGGTGLKDALEHLAEGGALQRELPNGTTYVLQARKRGGSTRRGSTR